MQPQAAAHQYNSCMLTLAKVVLCRYTCIYNHVTLASIKKITPQVERKEKKGMLGKATKVYVYLQCFSLSLSKPERTS